MSDDELIERQVTMSSILTRRVTTRTIKAPKSCWEEWDARFRSRGQRRNIQDIFPTLTASEREFLNTGITDEEWKMATGG